MNNERELANKIVRHLNRGLDTIKQGTVYQLQTARQSALDHYREAPQPLFGLEWAGEVAFRIGHRRHLKTRSLVVAGLMALSVAAVAYWQLVIQANDIAEIDASLLTDELPIDAYLDKNFEAWLKRSSQ